MCRYEVGKKKGEYDEETLKREQAKNALERYMHYYQRYNTLSYYHRLGKADLFIRLPLLK